jgi:hypothetical protein
MSVGVFGRNSKFDIILKNSSSIVFALLPCFVSTDAMACATLRKNLVGFSMILPLLFCKKYLFSKILSALSLILGSMR